MLTGQKFFLFPKWWNRLSEFERLNQGVIVEDRPIPNFVGSGQETHGGPFTIIYAGYPKENKMSHLDKHTFLITWKAWLEFCIPGLGRVLCMNLHSSRIINPKTVVLVTSSSIFGFQVPHACVCSDPSTCPSGRCPVSFRSVLRRHHVLPLEGRIGKQAHTWPSEQTFGVVHSAR